VNGPNKLERLPLAGLSYVSMQGQEPNLNEGIGMCSTLIGYGLTLGLDWKGLSGPTLQLILPIPKLWLVKSFSELASARSNLLMPQNLPHPTKYPTYDIKNVFSCPTLI